jgi:hypothetical protein
VPFRRLLDRATLHRDLWTEWLVSVSRESIRMVCRRRTVLDVEDIFVKTMCVEIREEEGLW